MNESGKTDGFAFALTLLATFGTIIYASYNYFQNTSIDVFWYALASGVIDVLIILSIPLIAYVLIKGILLEVPDNELKTSIEKYNSYLYTISITLSIGILILILSVFLVIKSKQGLVIFTIIAIILIIIISFLISRYSQNRSFVSGFVFGFIGLILVATLFWPPLFDVVLNSPLQGNVKVDMESIFYKSDIMIPVPIQVTGPHTGLRIFLYNKDRDFYFLKDQILLSEYNLSNLIYGENSILFGNGLENGK